MATIVNNPPSQSGGNGMGFLLGIIVLIVFVIALIWFGLPMINRATQSQSPQINVPDQIDVNVKQQ